MWEGGEDERVGKRGRGEEREKEMRRVCVVKRGEEEVEWRRGEGEEQRSRGGGEEQRSRGGGEGRGEEE